jgi:uncharacterized protein (TIGR03067 family)
VPDATTHPPDEAIEAFALGTIDPTEEPELEEHLAGCDRCQERAEAVTPDTLVVLLASARTRIEGGRPATPTPAPGGAATPPQYAATQGWDGPAPGSDGGDEPPAALADHPKYRPIRRLGTGGMGTVWLAEHAVMSRPVAVKVIRPDLLARPGAADRFLREVRAAARLHHPNIVTAFDAEQAGGSCLLAMEYVPGETLADRVAAGPVPVGEACRAARDAARGLAAAHAAGLVHRDVKPANLIRAADGAVKVLDFGLAGVAADATAAAGGDGLTGAGMVFGTPDYIAPEQAADPHAADARADVYGLGCTLYHLLAGRPPVPGGPVAAKLDAHRTRTPDPVPGLPPGLAAVLAKMTAKRPEDRYQSAAAAADALEPFTRAAEPRPTAPRRGRRSWSLVAAAGFLLAAVVAGGVAYTIHLDNQKITIRTNDQDVEVVMKRNGELVLIRDTKTGQTWEYDVIKDQIGLLDQPGGLKLGLGGREPFALKRDGKDVFTVTRTAVLPLPGKPDRDSILGTWEGVTAEIDGQPVPQEFIDTIRPTLTFTPDKVVARPNPLMPGQFLQAAAAKGILPKEAAAILEKGVEGVYHLDPTKSPKTIDLVTVGGVRRTGLGLYALDGDTLKLCLSLDPDRIADRPTEFTSRGGTLRGVFTLKRQPPDAVYEARRFDAGEKDGVWSVGFSPDGTKVLKGGGWDVVLYDRRTGQTTVSIRHGCWSAALSPDGKHILTATSGGTVHLWDAATGRQIQINVPQLGRVRNAVFSPDGRVAAASHNDNLLHLWNLSTGRDVESFPAFHEAVRSGAFTPDGKQILVIDDPDPRTLTLYEIKTGGRVRSLEGHSDQVYDVAVSADGRRALTGSLDKTVRLWDLTTGKELLRLEGHTGGVVAVALCPLGRRAVSGGKDATLRLWDLETGKEIKAFEGHTGDIISVAVSPDGRFAASGGTDKAVRLWRLPDPAAGPGR